MFHRPSFSPVSFSRISFNGATQPVEQSGRSGYWRLFYYQMQEEALKEKEPAVEVKAAEKPKLVAKTKKPQKPVVKVEEEPVFAVPPFKPIKLPIPTPPTPLPVLAKVWQTTQELRLMRAQYGATVLKYNQLDVVNDEDDIELLLLVA